MNNRGPAAQATEPTAVENNRRSSRAALSRHQRKCTVCQHPQREQIEQEFLQWRSPRTLAEDYQLTERAVYRHAHALRLFERRGNNLRFSLSHILERAEHVPVTADSIIEAVRIFAHISEDGRWVNPPRHVIIERIGQDSPASAPIASATDQKPASAARSLRQIAINAALEPAAPGAASEPHLKSHQPISDVAFAAPVTQPGSNFCESTVNAHINASPGSLGGRSFSSGNETGARRHPTRGATSASLLVPCDSSDETSSPARCSQSPTSELTTPASNRQLSPGKIPCNSLKTNDRVAV